MSWIKYYVVYKADLTQDMMDRCYTPNPYDLTQNIAKTKVVLPFRPDKIPVVMYSSGYDVYTEDEIEAYVADTDNGFNAEDEPVAGWSDTYGMTLDGVADYCTVNHFIFDSATKFTIGVSLEIDLSVSNTEYFYSKFDGTNKLEFYRYNSRIYVNINAGQSYASHDAQDGTHFFVATYDAGVVKIYQNGQEITSTVVTAHPSSIGTEFAAVASYIGSRSDGSTFAGVKLRDMFVSLDALNGTEIYNTYNSGTLTEVGENTTKTIASHWTFGDDASDDGTATIVDIVGDHDLTTHSVPAGAIS